MRIFVAGPLAKPIPADNVMRAAKLGVQLFMRGHLPYIPHLYHFWQLLTSPGAPVKEKDFLLNEENWAALSLSFMPMMDAVYLIDGESYYGTLECEFAQRLALPIYRNINEIPHVVSNTSVYSGVELNETKDLVGWVAILRGLKNAATQEK